MSRRENRISNLQTFHERDMSARDLRLRQEDHKVELNLGKLAKLSKMQKSKYTKK